MSQSLTDYPVASRVILKCVAGFIPDSVHVRTMVSECLTPSGIVSLHQRLDLDNCILEVADIHPATVAIFGSDETALVVMQGVPHDEKEALPTVTNEAGIIMIHLERESIVPHPMLRVSPAVRAIIDTITTGRDVLCFGVPVSVVTDECRDDPSLLYNISVTSPALMSALMNASRYHPSRLGADVLDVHCIRMGSADDKPWGVLATMFARAPSPSTAESSIVALRVAPILPFGFRKFQLSEEALWGGLRRVLGAMRASGNCWLYEGQLLCVRQQDVTPDECFVGDALEEVASGIRKSSADEGFKQTAFETRVVYCEIVSIITQSEFIDSSSGGFSQNGGYFVQSTRLEVGDISDGDGFIQLPISSTISSSPLRAVTSASSILEVLQQCIGYHASFESEGDDGDLPSLQAIVVQGDAGNLVFPTVQAVLMESAQLPFAVHDCRAEATRSTQGSVAFDYGIVELVREGCTASRPIALVVRHAELLEGNRGALHAVGQALERSRGYLIVILCHEGDIGGGQQASSNSNGESSGPSRAGGKLSSALASSLVATVHCAVPNEVDRIRLITGLFPPKGNVEGNSMWLPSLTLSPSLVASWTVGFTMMDIIAYVGTVVRRAYARYRRFFDTCLRLGSTLHGRDPMRLVLSDEDFFEGLSDYQNTHGLVVSSTKLQPVKWSDVGGLHEAKKEILETIQLPTRYPHLFKAGGMQRKMGILLFGPPGCGKTLLAKAVATEMNMNFLSVKGPELINQYVGESEKNVRDIFQRARDNAPCVLFFDELDALAPARGAKGDAGGAMDRIVSQLLVEMDGVDRGGGDVFIVAATNRPDMLDAALLRPGRFDQRCYLGPPDGVAEKALALKALTRKFSLSEGVNLSAVAERLQGMGRFTGADLFALCSDAMLFAVEERVAVLKVAAERALAEGRDEIAGEDEAMQVGGDHFERALAQLKPSVSREEFEKYERLRSNLDT